MFDVFFICFSFLFYLLLHCFVIWIILQWRVLISFFCDRNPPGPWFNTKMLFYQYRKSHCGDKMVVRSSYLHNGISYTGKMSSLYWIRAQGSMDSPYKEPVKWKAFPCHDMFCRYMNTLPMTLHQWCVPFTVHMDNCDKQTVIANTAKSIESEYIDYRLYLNTLRTKQNGWHFVENIDGLVQDCSISIALAMEILQSWTKPSVFKFIFWNGNHFILSKTSLNFGHRGPNDIKSSLASWPLKSLVT